MLAFHFGTFLIFDEIFVLINSFNVVGIFLNALCFKLEFYEFYISFLTV